MERMTDFFEKRADGYDNHMLKNVMGCKEGYEVMAALIPKNSKTLLDLGCGTGLELDEILKRIPDIKITGIDLTQAMLNKLELKYPDKRMNLICGSYFDIPFGMSNYDCVISFQSLHHYTHEMKTGLYRKINEALNTCGVYIECDYMVETQEDEDFYFEENKRIRKSLNIAEDEFYHYDTPCTIVNQTRLLHNAGFAMVDQVFRMENTTILVAKKLLKVKSE